MICRDKKELFEIISEGAKLPRLPQLNILTGKKMKIRAKSFKILVNIVKK
jgi:hypothetical protein